MELISKNQLQGIAGGFDHFPEIPEVEVSIPTSVADLFSGSDREAASRDESIVL